MFRKSARRSSPLSKAPMSSNKSQSSPASTDSSSPTPASPGSSNKDNSSPSTTPTKSPVSLPPTSPKSSTPISAQSTPSTVRVPSPLNPSSSPPTSPLKPSVSLPPTSGDAQSRFRPRGRSTSTLRTVADLERVPSSSSINIASLSRVTSAPEPPDITYSVDTDRPESTFRDRSRSRSPAHSARNSSPGHHFDALVVRGSATPPGAMSQSWWTKTEELVHRPWKDQPRRKVSVPSEQTEGWVQARSRVAEAAVSVLGVAGDIAHEALLLSADALQFAPIAGLSEAARTLLSIWDALQMVDMNRLACLRLTQRCADILMSVREEIADAGDSVEDELHAPIAKLVAVFARVHNLLQKQNHRPFLKRYLKREEILRQIAGCDSDLSDSLGMFSLSIQIRILKQVQNTELRQQADTQAVLSTLHSLPSPASPSHVLSTLQTIQSAQNSADQESDLADLRQLMRAALTTSNDSAMIEVLQVGRDEMPEAIKTLQRALEREVEKDDTGGAIVRRRASVVNLRATAEIKSAAIEPLPQPAPSPKTPGLVRRLTGSRAKTQAPPPVVMDGTARDTLDREFIESGIDAMRRLSQGPSLPSWTITRYEIDREDKIGLGFFSDVYRGVWRGRTVAIKVLAPTTPRSLFLHEIAVWRTLKHPNVLRLCGASSARGEPPWFLVSEYCEGGSLVGWLRERRWDGGMGANNGEAEDENRSNEERKGDGNGKREEVDLLRCMHEVSKGMKYLHACGVLHGDLKAANVLVDAVGRCVISDFGQSEMKSEAARISGVPIPHGTLRWQAPELLRGQNSLTTQIDVYAFSICCIEILDMGAMPWLLTDDATVARLVLDEDQRPPIPTTPPASPALANLLRLCWDVNPSRRPAFVEIERELKMLRIRAGSYGQRDIQDEAEEARVAGLTANGGRGRNRQAVGALGEVQEEVRTGMRPSPDMHPISLPNVNDGEAVAMSTGNSPESSASYRTAKGSFEHEPTPPSSAPVGTSHFPRSSLSASSDPGVMQDPVPLPAMQHVHQLSSANSTASDVKENAVLMRNNSSTSSLFESTPSDSTTLSRKGTGGPSGYTSPLPEDEATAKLQDERRYRLLLAHEFHPSLTLPLWTPTSIALGAVGYLSKPSGEFKTLLNAFDPSHSSDGLARGMPSVYGYGKVTTARQVQDRRTTMQKSLDAIQGLFKSGTLSQNSSRRYSYALRSGHKAAYLCTETTVYNYVESLDAPKRWFKAHVDTLMKLYGTEHHIQKEDLYFVVGTLDAPDYALFVSHSHPDAHMLFDVFSSPKNGQPWGKFSMSTQVSPEVGGPTWDQETPAKAPVFTDKVSKVGSVAKGRGYTVLLARLRFKPDVLEPTLL